MTLVVVACLLPLSPIVEAENCGAAHSAIETTVCHTPELSSMDAELNRLYSGLRPQLTVKARTQLLEQQRTWLAERNRDCGNGDAGCLRKKYEDRIDQLQGLDAAAQAAEDKLKDISSVLVVKGKWKASAIRDPAASKPVDAASLSKHLSDSGLPPVGGIVSMVPGKLCLPADACELMAWDRTTLARVGGGEAIGRVFGLKQTQMILEGDSGAKHVPGYELLPQGDGSVWAVFILCGPNASDCRMAAEVWTPASPDASVSPRP